LTASGNGELCVVGLVYFEVDCPRPALAPAPGQELFVARLPVRLGGALNTASVARALGLATTLCYPRGGGLTDIAAAAVMTRLGLDVSTWPTGDDPALSLVYRDAGDRSFISAADLAGLGRCPPLPPARWIHVAGLREVEAIAPRLAEARARGTHVSVSGSWAPDLLDALHREHGRPWDTLFLNASELSRAAAAAGADARGERAWLAVAGAAPEVVVTLGAQGAVLYRDDATVESPSSAVEVVDATGAGDAFVAGFVAARLRGDDDRAALALGVEAARRILGVTGGVALDPTLFSDLRRENPRGTP
jgi:sugar/nucleoside kinase (ribokinase family)